MPPLFQGHGVAAAGAADRESRSAGRICAARCSEQNLAFLRELNRRHLASIRAKPIWKPASPATNWPRPCKRRPTRRSISRETAATQRLYGLDDHAHARIRHPLPDRPPAGRARRPVRAVFPRRPALGQPHDIRSGLPAICRRTDKPAAALVKDLKARDARYDGRSLGRRNRPPAGHGKSRRSGQGRPRPQRPGFQHVARRRRLSRRHDLWRDRRIRPPRRENIVTPNDFQATLLHLFGLDHKELTYLHSGASSRSRPGAGAWCAN